MRTPGPWKIVTLPDGVLVIVGCEDDNGERHSVCKLDPRENGLHPDRAEDDAEFIVWACNTLAWWADRRDR